MLHAHITPTRRPLAGRIAFAPALCALLAMPGWASAQTTAVNGQIAYVASGPSTIPFGPTTQSDIWVMNADGSGQTNLTNTTDLDEFSPAWSADGTRLAYVSDSFTNTLMVMNADGSGKTVVASGVLSPTWDPSGTRLAVVRGREGLTVDIVIIDLATGAEQTVTGPVDFGGILLDTAEMEPVWSPDGAKIAFTDIRLEQYPDPVTGEPTTGAQYEIVVVNVDGTGAQIVSAGDAGTERALFLEEDRAPAWSPDGSRLIFMSQAQAPSCCGPWQIWSVNRDGTGAVNLTNDPAINELFPSWSPDGTAILFTRAEGSGYNLYTRPAPAPAPAAARLAGPTVLAVAAADTATPLTSDGNAQDGVWGRKSAPVSTARYRLSVEVEGRRGGKGTVTSSPAGIVCGRTCSARFPDGTVVTLQATPRADSTFAGWSGACSGRTTTCTVTMSQARRVTATFRRRR